MSQELLSLPMERHFTATAFIVDSQQRTLLLWHKRLGRWMPPGGHVDPNETPEETARRECKEETGLDVEIVGESQEDMFAGNPTEGQMLKKPIALLLEEIPECPERGEVAHQHMDFVYLARPLDEAQNLTMLEEEAGDMQWFTREEIEALDENTEIFSNVKRYILSILPQ
jgi:8-oxo-dGTP pyrophosphatase MutT (NUDIX family)